MALEKIISTDSLNSGKDKINSNFEKNIKELAKIQNQAYMLELEDRVVEWTYTDGFFVASDTHANPSLVGTLVSHARYKYSDIKSFVKGTVLLIKSSNSPNVANLSKWTIDGKYVSTALIAPQNTEVTYTVEDEIEYLRFSNDFVSVPGGYVKVKANGNNAITAINDRLATEEEQSSRLSAELQSLKLASGNIKLSPAWNNGFIASSVNAIGEGNIGGGSPASYMYSSNIKFKKGEKVTAYLFASQSTLAISKWTADGVFIEAIATGEGSAQNYEYTVVEDVEYLRFTNHFGTVKSDRLSIQINSSNLLLDKINSLAENKETSGGMNPQAIRKPVVTFIFDDGRATDPNVYDIFNQYGFKCGFALLGTNTESSKYLGYQNEGFEILSHSTKHPVMSTMSETFTYDMAKSEIVDSKKTLEETGYKIKGWVTPSNQLASEFLPLVKNHYEYAYTDALSTWEPTMSELPQNIFKEDTRILKRVSMESTRLGYVFQAIDKVIMEGGMLTFYAHDYPSAHVPEDSMTRILDYCKEKVNADELLVLTPFEAYKHCYTLRHSDIKSLII